MARGTPERSAGFTLIELIMAVMILAVMTVLSFFCFDAVVSSWNAGMEMADSMAQADYVMNQIESGLRSACYLESVQEDRERGFQLYDNGDGEDALDRIEWMKEGRAFVGALKAVDGRTEIAEMPHRVMLYVEPVGHGEGGLMAKAWSNDFQPDDFDVEEDVKAFLVSPKVVALDCKVLKEPQTEHGKEIEWADEWSESNALPYKVSITLYLQPAKERDPPLAVTRDIEIPLWDVSQNPIRSGGGKQGGERDQTGTRPGQVRPDGPGGAGEPGGMGGGMNRPGGMGGSMNRPGGMGGGGGGMGGGGGGMGGGMGGGGAP